MKPSHLSIRIPPNLNQQLTDYATVNQLSKTQVMLEALAQYLNCEIEFTLPKRVAALEKRLAKLESTVNPN